MSLANVYQCFSHPDRLRIIALLRERPLCVQELQAVLLLSQVEVSKHLAYLRRNRFVVSASSGTWRIYQLRDDLPFDLSRHLQCLRECIDHGKLLQEEFERLRALPTKRKKTPAKQRRAPSRPPRIEIVPDEPAAQPGTDLTTLEDHLL